MKGRDPTDCASYCPISLLNTDKILEKVLAHGLENALPNIKSIDQTGFLKSRYSYFNKHRLHNIIYSASENAPECVISLDVQKAFDCVEWNYSFTVLHSFGFGNFISLNYHTITQLLQFALWNPSGVPSEPFALLFGY